MQSISTNEFPGDASGSGDRGADRGLGAEAAEEGLVHRLVVLAVTDGALDLQARRASGLRGRLLGLGAAPLPELKTYRGERIDAEGPRVRSIRRLQASTPMVLLVQGAVLMDPRNTSLRSTA
jgi:hypothetical protein